METEYKIVSGYPAYRVGNDGTAWSRRQKTGNRWIDSESWWPLEGSVHHDGYRYITLYRDGTARSRKIAALVCEAFHGPRPEKMEACHDNGIRTDDHADNLYWGTRRENAADRQRHGRTANGERNGFSKLTDSQVAEIIALRGKMSQEKIGRRFGISQTHIGRIFSGKARQLCGVDGCGFMGLQ